MTDSNVQKPAMSGAFNEGEQRGASFGESTARGDSAGTEFVGQAKTAVSRMRDQTTRMVRTRVSERASQSASQVADFARALRQTGQGLEGNLAAPLVGRAADQLDRVAELLDSNDPDKLVGNVERFARQQPLLFLGGAFALGLAGARFLKSSAAHTQSSDSYEQMGGPSGAGEGLSQEFRQ